MKEIDPDNSDTIDEDKEHWLKVLRDAKARKAEYTEIEKNAKAELLQGFTSETGFFEGRPVFQYIKSEQKYFDLEGFRADHPELAAQYTKKRPSAALYLLGDS